MPDNGEGQGNSSGGPGAQGAAGGTGGQSNGGSGDGEGGGGGSGSEPPGGSGGGQPKTYNEDYVKGLRKEAGDARAKAKDLETRLKALEDEKLSDTEKKDRELQDLRKQTVELAAKARAADIKEAAITAGATRPGLVAKLVPDDLDIADSDKLEAALKKIKTEYPELFTKSGNGANGSADGGAGGGGTAKPSMNDWIRQAAGRR